MRTKIFILLVSLLCLPIQTIEAQEAISPNVTNTVIWGIKANLNAELPTKWHKPANSIKMFNSGFGASVGALANIYLGRNFYFEPEIGLFYQGYSYDNIVTVAPNSPSVNAGPSLTKLGLRLPLVFGYFINISETWGLDVFTGPLFNYAFYGHASSENEDIKSDYSLMNVFKGDFAQKRFGVDWKVGVGFPVQNFLISLEADFGITNRLRHNWTMRENRVSLGITYYFVNNSLSTE